MRKHTQIKKRTLQKRNETSANLPAQDCLLGRCLALSTGLTLRGLLLGQRLAQTLVVIVATPVAAQRLQMLDELVERVLAWVRVIISGGFLFNTLVVSQTHHAERRRACGR